MNSAFEKFGIYDFMGIWGPGALTVTYYLFTLRASIDVVLSYFDIDLSGIPIKSILIILYTAGAYLLGVVLHELGKIIIDAFPCFCLSDINTRIYQKDIKRCPKILLLKRIKYEHQQAHKKYGIVVNRDNKAVEFEKAICFLKYDKNVSTRRIDTYHSVYALSRSLCLCFLSHLIIVSHTTQNLYLLFTDLILVFLFFIRTYRYFHSWVKNVYIQYYTTVASKHNETDEITKIDI